MQVESFSFANFKIMILPSTMVKDTAAVTSVTDLINSVFAISEAGLLKQNATRTTYLEVQQFISIEQILAVWHGNNLIGVVRYSLLDNKKAQFGMLAVSNSYQGKGLGKHLVKLSEQLASKDGRNIMEIEVLRAVSQNEPSKEFLRIWYEGLGYHLVGSKSVDAHYPQYLPLLAKQCVLDIYQKAI